MTRPRQHNAIEVFTLPLGFTKLSRLRVLFKDSCNLSVFWSPPETLEVPLWTQLVLKRATLLENFMSAQKWSLDTSSKWLQSWNLVSKPHCALSVLQLNQLKVCCLNFSAKVSRQEVAERERHKLTFEKSTVQRCYVEMAEKPEHHFFCQRNFFFPPRGSNCFPSVSAGGN